MFHGTAGGTNLEAIPDAATANSDGILQRYRWAVGALASSTYRVGYATPGVGVGLNCAVVAGDLNARLGVSRCSPAIPSILVATRYRPGQPPPCGTMLPVVVVGGGVDAGKNNPCRYGVCRQEGVPTGRT